MLWYPFFCDDDAVVNLAPNCCAASDEEPQCDYDTNCTALFKRIEGKEWEVVTTFLDTGFWPYSLLRDSPPPSEQARTWVIRRTRDPTNSAGIKWRQLPLHLAIVLHAPLDVIRRLVELYPDSIAAVDDHGMLPLHLALRYSAPEELVNFLLQAYPDACGIKGKGNRTALDFAMHADKAVRIKLLTLFAERHGTDKNIAMKAKALHHKLDRDLKEIQRLLLILEHEQEMTEQELHRCTQELMTTQRLLEEQGDELEEATKSVELATSLKLDRNSSFRELGELVEMQRLELLQTSQQDLLKEEKRMKEEEQALQTDLQTIRETIARAFDKDGTAVLKRQVKALTVRRAMRSRQRTLIEMDQIKETLRRNLSTVEGRSEEELEAMRMVLEGLETTNLRMEPQQDLIELKTELEPFSEELRRTQELVKTRKELQILWRLLAKELMNADDMEPEALDDLTATIVSMRQSKLDHCSLEELQDMKAKARQTKTTVQGKVLVRQTRRDLRDFHNLVKQRFEQSDDKDVRAYLSKMSAALDGLICRNMKKDILAIRTELIAMKDDFLQMEAATSLRPALKIVSDELLVHTKKATGKTRRELSEMHTTLESMRKSSLRFKTKEDLISFKSELESLHLESLKPKEISRFKTALDKMRDILHMQGDFNSQTSKPIIIYPPLPKQVPSAHQKQPAQQSRSLHLPTFSALRSVSHTKKSFSFWRKTNLVRDPDTKIAAKNKTVLPSDRPTIASPKVATAAAAVSDSAINETVISIERVVPRKVHTVKDQTDTIKEDIVIEKVAPGKVHMVTDQANTIQDKVALEDTEPAKRSKGAQKDKELAERSKRAKLSKLRQNKKTEEPIKAPDPAEKDIIIFTPTEAHRKDPVADNSKNKKVLQPPNPPSTKVDEFKAENDDQRKGAKADDQKIPKTDQQIEGTQQNPINLIDGPVAQMEKQGPETSISSADKVTRRTIFGFLHHRDAPETKVTDTTSEKTMDSHAKEASTMNPADNASELSNTVAGIEIFPEFEDLRNAPQREDNENDAIEVKQSAKSNSKPSFFGFRKRKNKELKTLVAPSNREDELTDSKSNVPEKEVAMIHKGKSVSMIPVDLPDRTNKKKDDPPNIIEHVISGDDASGDSTRESIIRRRLFGFRKQEDENLCQSKSSIRDDVDILDVEIVSNNGAFDELDSVHSAYTARKNRMKKLSLFPRKLKSKGKREHASGGQWKRDQHNHTAKASSKSDPDENNQKSVQPLTKMSNLDEKNETGNWYSIPRVITTSKPGGGNQAVQQLAQ